jgi:hypothetical protein
MSNTWTTIPEFPDYQVNMEGDVRFTESKDEVPMIFEFDTACYDLVKGGKIYTKTQRGLIDAANPHISRSYHTVQDKA